MADIKFTSSDCKKAASALTTAAGKLKTILNTDIKEHMQSAQSNYKSDSANKIYSAYKKVSEQFPDFLKSVNNCASYLSDTVAPAYEAVETKVQNNVKM